MPDFTDVYPWIRQCLDSAGSDKPDSFFDPTIRSVMRQILSSSGRAYADLGADDKDAVSEAAGYRTAARLWRPLVTGGLGGELTSAKDDDASESYAGGDKLLAEWQALANVALRTVSFLKGKVPTLALSALNGPSRARREERLDRDEGIGWRR